MNICSLLLLLFTASLAGAVGAALFVAFLNLFSRRSQ
jgi:hypothetical protein